MAAYRGALELIRHKPWLIALGSARSVLDFFIPRFRSSLGFTGMYYGKWVGGAVAAFFGLAFLSGTLQLRKMGPAFTVLFVGLIFSVLFMPPLDADAMRAYAVTLPFQCLVAAFGIASGFPPAQLSVRNSGRWPSQAAAGVGIVIGLLLLWPLLAFRPLPAAADIAPGITALCRDGSTARVLTVYAASPNITNAARLEMARTGHPYPGLFDPLTAVFSRIGPFQLAHAYDLIEKRWIDLIVPTRVESAGTFSACTHALKSKTTAMTLEPWEIETQ